MFRLRHVRFSGTDRWFTNTKGNTYTQTNRIFVYQALLPPLELLHDKRWESNVS